MKTFLTILCVVAFASVAWAEKPVQTVDIPDTRIECSFQTVVYNWDFREGDQGFTTASCDDEGAPVWEHGYWPVGDVVCWGTSLQGNYPNDTGHSLISPTFMVDASTYLVDVAHGYDTEISYDGGNLSVNGIVVEPMEGYPDDEISDSTTYYAWCVDGEPGFTGYSGTEIVHNCFDLTPFLGQEVQLSFDFGSDSSANDQGWMIVDIDVGSDVVPVQGTTWSNIKGMYR